MSRRTEHIAETLVDDEAAVGKVSRNWALSAGLSLDGLRCWAPHSTLPRCQRKKRKRAHSDHKQRCLGLEVENRPRRAKAKVRNNQDALKTSELHLSLLLLLMLVEFKKPSLHLQPVQCRKQLAQSKKTRKSAHVEPHSGS